MFSYLSAEERVPSNHPLRAVRQVADKVLGELSKLFARMYSQIGRLSIPPEKLLMEAIPGDHPVTVGADKGYDTKDFVEEARNLKATPHVAQKKHSAIDGRTTRHAGYGVSQQKRKRVEEIFGWMKTIGGMRKLRHRGLQLVGWMYTFAAAAYNLVRIRNLSTALAGGKV